MSGCNYEQEDFCLFEDMEGYDGKCGFKDKTGHCTAKPSDLEEGCSECEQPLDLCTCVQDCKKENEIQP